MAYSEIQAKFAEVKLTEASLLNESTPKKQPEAEKIPSQNKLEYYFDSKKPESVVAELESQKVSALPDTTKYPGDELNYMELLERARTLEQVSSDPSAWPIVTVSPDNAKFFRVVNRCKGKTVHIKPPKENQKNIPGIEPGTYAVFSAIFREAQFLYSKMYLFLDTEENLAENINIATDANYEKTHGEGEQVIIPKLEPHRLISDSDTTRLLIDKMDVKWIFENKQLSAIDICADGLSSEQRKVKWMDMVAHGKWLKLYAHANKMNEEWITPKVAEVLQRNKKVDTSNTSDASKAPANQQQE
jgi:hypothetical protein